MVLKHKSGNLFNRLKNLLGRFFAPIIIIIFFLIMLIAKSDLPIVERIKAGALDIVNPVIRVISYPSQGISYIIDVVNELVDIRQENIRLKEENKVLVEWRNYAQKVESDFNRLSKIANYVAPPDASFVTAKIIGDSGSSFSQTLIAIAGSDNNVKKGMVAITDDGVIGRVIYTGNNTSRILLLNDINSRLPVVVGESKLRAMLIGTNKDAPAIVFLPIDAKVEIGDKVSTSGFGGIFPPDLNVGVVSKVSEEEILVELYVDRNLLSFVKLVDYNLESILPNEEDEKNEKPKKVAKKKAKDDI